MMRYQKPVMLIVSVWSLTFIVACSDSAKESQHTSFIYTTQPTAIDDKETSLSKTEEKSTSSNTPPAGGPQQPKRPVEKDKEAGFLKKGGIGSDKYSKGKDNHDNRKKRNQTVGYFDVCSNQGNQSQFQTIRDAATVTAPLTPLSLPNLSQESLSHINVLFLNNCDAETSSATFAQALPEITEWIHRGGRLIFHDQFIGGKSALPALADVSLIHDNEESANIEIALPDTRVTKGPKGILTNESLDGANNAVKGFAEKYTLPEKSKAILSTSNPEHVVTFSYCFGSGGVVYSTIPLDFQAETHAEEPVLKTIKEIYAPNVVSYGAHGHLCN